MRTDVTQTANCIATVFWTITVIVPLQKFRKKKLRKGAITNEHSNGSTSPSRLLTNVTITEKLKNPKFSQQKVAVFTETEPINNFDKSHNSVLNAKIQHFVSITNINNNVMALWSHHAIFGTSFHLRNKTKTEIAYTKT